MLFALAQTTTSLLFPAGTEKLGIVAVGTLFASIACPLLSYTGCAILLVVSSE